MGDDMLTYKGPTFDIHGKPTYIRNAVSYKIAQLDTFGLSLNHAFEQALDSMFLLCVHCSHKPALLRRQLDLKGAEFKMIKNVGFFP